MRYAIDDNNNKIEVSQSGEIANCLDCNSLVIGNYGKIRPK